MECDHFIHFNLSINLTASLFYEHFLNSLCIILITSWLKAIKGVVGFYEYNGYAKDGPENENDLQPMKKDLTLR